MDDHVDRGVVDIVQPACFDDLQALVGERRRVDRDLRSHRPRRVTERLVRRDRGQVRAGRRGTARPRPSGSGAATRSIGSPTRHCQIAECSLSIGRSHASGLANGSSGRDDATSAARRRASGITRWPPATSVSLLAVATTFPAARAARTGRRLTIPPVATTTRSTSGARRQLDQGVGPLPRDAAGAGGELQRVAATRARPRPGGTEPPAPRGRRPARRPQGRRPRRRPDGARGRRAPGSRSSRSSRGRRPAGGRRQRYAARTYRRTTGAANRNESTRSSTPP